MRKVLFALVLLAGAPARAQTPTAGGTNLTLADVERLALDRNPQLAEARLEVAAADYQVALQQAARSPLFSASLLRGLRFDSTRAQIAQARIARRIADVALRREAATLLATAGSRAGARRRRTLNNIRGPAGTAGSCNGADERAAGAARLSSRAGGLRSGPGSGLIDAVASFGV